MFLIRFLIFFNILFCYYSHDPIMMGLSGSYNTSAKGYNCVGINPANLAFEDDSYIGLFGMNLNLSNNLFNQHRLNDISGTYLDDSKKDQIISYLDGGPIRINSFFNMPVLMNFSFNKMAFTSNIKYLSAFELSQDFLKLILDGNSNIGEEFGYELSMNNDFAIIWESSFTRAFDLNPFGLGFTIKYLKGLSYYTLEPTQDPYFYTDFTDITSKSTYIMKENSGGEGFAFDFGLTTKRTESGWKFGASVINFFGHIKWNKSNSPSLLSLYDTNESYLINLSINELNMQNLNSFETDEIFRVDANTVYQVDVLPDNIATNGVEGSDYYCSDEDCSSYYINSDDYKVDNIVLTENSILSMEYPTSLSLGFSKQLNENKLITFDFLTGFDTSWNNMEKWRLSTGYIFGTYKKPLRLGLSYGGYDYKSIGFSFGFKGKKDKFNVDFGLCFTDSYNVSKVSGFDYGINMYWLNQK